MYEMIKKVIEGFKEPTWKIDYKPSTLVEQLSERVKELEDEVARLKESMDYWKQTYEKSTWF